MPPPLANLSDEALLSLVARSDEEALAELYDRHSPFVLGVALKIKVMSERSTAQIVGLDTRLDALYFTMTTLLTIGFGDIHATGQAARALVLVQMVFNVVIIATAASTINTRVRTKAEIRAEERRAAIADGSLQVRTSRRQARRTHRNPT